MKNSKSKSDLEARIIGKITELVSELKVEGRALSKSIETAARKIAKHLSKKLRQMEKKKVLLKKIKPVVSRKKASAKTSAKLKKPVFDEPASGVPEPSIVKAQTRPKAKPLAKKPVVRKTVLKKAAPAAKGKK